MQATYLVFHLSVENKGPRANKFIQTSPAAIYERTLPMILIRSGITPDTTQLKSKQKAKQEQQGEELKHHSGQELQEALSPQEAPG